MFECPYIFTDKNHNNNISIESFLDKNIKTVSTLDELKNTSNKSNKFDRFKKKLTKKFSLQLDTDLTPIYMSIVDDHDDVYFDVSVQDKIYIISDTVILVYTSSGTIFAIQYGKCGNLNSARDICIENSVISSDTKSWFIKDRKYLYLRIDGNVYINLDDYRTYRLKIALVDDSFNIIKELKFKDTWFKQHIATKKDYIYLLLQNRDWVSTHIITVDLKNYRIYKFKIKKNMVNFYSQVSKNIINKYLICEYQDGTFSLVDLTTGKIVHKDIAKVKHYKKRTVLTLKNGKKATIFKD